MPGFNFSSLKCFRNIALLFSVIWGASIILHYSNVLLPIYERSLGNIPSHMFASGLAKYKSQCDNEGVLFIGPSTVREGFDADQHQKLTSICSINAGVTSHGSIYHMALLLDITQNLNIRPTVLVVGINSRMLSDRVNPIVENRYIDFITEDQIRVYQNHEYKEKLPELEKIALINTLFPLARYSVRIDYLSRYFLMSTNQALSMFKNLQLKHFSGSRGSLKEPKKYYYDDEQFNEKAFLSQIEKIKRRGFYDRTKYGWSDHKNGLRMVLERASEISSKVIVVVMPEHSEIRKSFGAHADRELQEILKEYRSQALRVIDYSDSVNDQLFRDMAHLTGAGRDHLTKKFSTITSSYLGN